MRKLTLLLAGTFLFLATAGCDLGLSDPPPTRPARVRPVNAGGSTFVNPMMQKWCQVYKEKTGKVVHYLSCGSGAGIKNMTVQTFDFGGTDGPMNEEQLRKAREIGGEVVHVPLCMGGNVAAYNLPEVEKPIRFDSSVLADIYLGKITKWNDPALKALNPEVMLPDLDIVVVHRSDGSGTTWVWTEYLSKTSKDWEKRVGYGVDVKWPCGVGKPGNEGCTAHIVATHGALGYIELTFALQNKLKMGLIKNRDGYYVRPSLENFSAAAVGGLRILPDDLRYSLNNMPGKESYPIVGTVWALVYVDQPPETGQAIVDFLRWATHEGQSLCEPLHYAQLPPDLVKRCEEKLNQIKVGH